MSSVLAHPAAIVSLAAFSLLTAAADATSGGLLGSITGLILAVASLLGAVAGLLGGIVALRRSPHGRRR